MERTDEKTTRSFSGNRENQGNDRKKKVYLKRVIEYLTRFRNWEFHLNKRLENISLFIKWKFYFKIL